MDLIKILAEGASEDVKGIILLILLVVGLWLVMETVTGDLRICRKKDGTIIKGLFGLPMIKSAKQRANYDMGRLEGKLGATVREVLSHPDTAKYEPFLSILHDMKATSEAVATVSDKLNEVLCSQSKVAFYSEGLSPAERISEGLRYVAAKGNGSVKADIVAFCQEHRAEYEGAVAAKPSWRGLIDV